MEINFCSVSPTELHSGSDAISPSADGTIFGPVSGGKFSHQYSICTFESLPNWNHGHKINQILLHSAERASWYILIIKPTRCALISQIYFWNRTLRVLDRFSVHHQESSTVYTAIGICHTGCADGLLASSQHNLYDINLLLCVQC